MLLTLSVQLFGQRVNRNDEKMVSAVHIDEYFPSGSLNEHIDILYTYSVDGYLDRLTRNAIIKGKSYKDIIERNSNGSFKRQSYYNGRSVNEHIYEYETNEYGLFKFKTDRSVINGDSITVITGYSYDNNGEWILLDQIHRIKYVKDGNEWSEAHDAYYINFDYSGGKCFWNNMHSSNFNISGKREYYNEDVKIVENKYSSIKNDTNINPNLFFSMLCWEICLDAHEFELSSEWCGMKSEYILHCENGIEINSVVRDNNLVEMYVKYKNGRIYRRMKIDYLY